MKKFFKKFILFENMSLKKRLIIYFSLITIIPLSLVGAIGYKSAENAIKNNVSRYAIDKLNQTNKNIDIYLQDSDNLCLTIFFDTNLKNKVISSDKSEFALATSQNDIQKILQGYIYPRNYIRQIYIIDKHNRVYSSNNELFENSLIEQQWYKDFAVSDDKKRIIATHDGSSYSLMGTNKQGVGNVITIIRRFYDFDRNMDIGILCMDIDYQAIKSIFTNSNMENSDNIFVTTEDGKILYNENEKLLGKSIPNEYKNVLKDNSGSFIYKASKKDYMVVYNTSSLTRWKVIQVVPMYKLMVYADYVKESTIIICFICIILSLLLAFFIAYNISRPITILKTEMKKVENGNFDVNVDISRKDEIGQLSYSFMKMIEELKQLIDTIYKEEGEKKKIELNMLQQQINPHFLYNTLDSINWMARIQNASGISAAITSLIKLLQTSTNIDIDFVTVKDEMEYIINYVSIQKFRYGDNFEVLYDVDKGILDKKILKMILQPIVENAIYHGLEGIGYGGIIKVLGYQNSDNIIFCVEDNGKGISIEKIESILISGHRNKDSLSGVGMYNVQKRIKLYYGENYGLNIIPLNKGTRVEIVIPLS